MVRHVSRPTRQLYLQLLTYYIIAGYKLLSHKTSKCTISCANDQHLSSYFYFIQVLYYVVKFLVTKGKLILFYLQQGNSSANAQKSYSSAKY